MTNRTNVSVLMLLAALLVAIPVAQAQQPPTSAPDNDFILRGSAAEIAGVLARHGLTEVGRLDSAPPGEEVCLVRAASAVSPEQVIADITAQEPSVIAIEEVFLASLPETYENIALNQAIGDVLGALGDTSTVLFDKDSTGTDRNVWTGYVEQDADGLVRASSARTVETGDGAIVAIIDTGVDPDHPLLDPHLVPGYDFLLDQAGDASELGALDESTMVILDESTMVILDDLNVVALSESTMVILDDDQTTALDPAQIPEAFGHGTMVAGIVHLVAPEAKIMPLRAFDGDGHASVFNIVRAINYAVDNGATVIHMSFSLEIPSQELVEAIDYADQNGVIVVASAGNEGLETMVFPAGLCNVFGVAATDIGDSVSSFSNLGNYLVDVAAPGENVITSYPGGGWAGASGTSFAAPWISGAVALLADAKGSGAPGSIGFSQVNAALSWADPASGSGASKIGHGRVDLRSALDNLSSDPPTGGSGCSGSSNLDPSVTITAPATGLTFSQGASLTFTGTASDTEDGDIAAALAWSSSLDGAVGTGGSFSISTLSLGTHAISAAVTDSVLLNGSDAITVTIGAPPPALPTKGQAVWRTSGSDTPKTTAWDGTTFGAAVSAASSAGGWRIMTGAASPTRDEKIVVGIDSGDPIQGMIWDGSSWSRISISGSTNFGSVTQTFWWGAGVAYEAQSGDAMVVYNDQPNLKFSVWDGGSWSAEATISSCVSSEPKHMRLAADPSSDEMVLVVNHSNETDCVLVWDGSSWGNAMMLDSTTSQDRTDIYVAYESQSGDALVVYNNNSNSSMAYRTWNGTTWSAQGTISAPSGPSSYARWAVMAPDPTSDRIVLGVQTADPDGWVTVWDGTGWQTAVEVTESSLVLDTNTSPNLAVAFESSSGEALAVYGRGNQSVFFHRTWSSSGGWSTETVGANLGANTNSMVLSADPGSDQIMLAIQDNGSDLNYVLWDGFAWGVPSQQEGDTGESKNQPFLFLWDQAASSGGGGGPGNAPPSATITSPAGGSTFIAGHGVTFTGTAIDAEDGGLTAALTWSSDLDGSIGTGGSFSTATLSVGSHIVTVTVIDSGGSSNSVAITLTVVSSTTQLVASQDTYIQEEKQDENKGNDSDLKLKAKASKALRALVQFDLSSLPTTVNIASAKLKLYVTGEKAGVTVNLHRLTQSWMEGTGDKSTGADWNASDDPQAWTQSGGDFDAQILGSVVPATKDVYVEIDVTALVQAWADGVLANEGFLLDATGADDEVKFGSREKSGKEPLLEIVY